MNLNEMDNRYLELGIIQPLDDFSHECCENPNIIQESGFEVCMNCGTTHARIIDQSKNAYYSIEKESKFKTDDRIFSPIGPRTLIDGHKDAHGNYLKSESIPTFRRLSKINRSLINGYERNLWIALPILRFLKSSLDLPQYIYYQAFQIYLKAVEKRLTLGRSIRGLVAASLLASLKVFKIPRLMQEIFDVVEISKKELNLYYRLVYTEVLPELKLKTERIGYQKYITKFCETLGLSDDLKKGSLKIFKSSVQNGLIISGKNPRGLAAGAIYLCSNVNKKEVTQKAICNISNISEVILRTRFKEIKHYCTLF